MVLILQFGRLDLLQLLRQGRHDERQSTNRQGEVVFNEKKNGLRSWGWVEEEKEEEESVVDAEDFFFFFFFYGAAFLGAAIDKTSWTSCNCCIPQGILQILHTTDTQMHIKYSHWHAFHDGLAVEVQCHNSQCCSPNPEPARDIRMDITIVFMVSFLVWFFPRTMDRQY